MTRIVSIAFRLSASRLQDHIDLLRNVWRRVSIAFRLSASRLRGAGKSATPGGCCLVSIAFRLSASRLRPPRLAGAVWKVRSPLPFGFLLPGYIRAFVNQRSGIQLSPLPFGFLLPGYAYSRPLDVPTQRRLHCLSAFCFPATLHNRAILPNGIPESPLPVGFLLPGYWIKNSGID